jgi:hemolysin-activating ACP:hemolysin acyltransferase
MMLLLRTLLAVVAVLAAAADRSAGEEMFMVDWSSPWGQASSWNLGRVPCGRDRVVIPDVRARVVAAWRALRMLMRGCPCVCVCVCVCV